MRFLLPLALALAACSSDPTDQNPPPPQDVQATDIGVDATDTGVDRLVVDVSDDRPAPIDNGPADAGVDASFHSDPIPLADLGFDLGADAGGDAADAAAMDAPTCGRCTANNAVTRCLVQAGEAPRCTIESCLPGYADCDGTYSNGCEVQTTINPSNCGGCGQACPSGTMCRTSRCLAPDASVDAPDTGRVDCVADENVRCTTNEECQMMCLPYMPGRTWCCPGRHHCIPTTISDVCGPYINP